MDTKLHTQVDTQALVKLIDPFKSQTERTWAQIGGFILEDELGVGTLLQQYEPMTFHIPGGRYRPDFLHILADGRMVFVECKGSKKQRNYRDARSKLRATASLHPWATWIEARRIGENWEIEIL
jgi:hypothetical protein